jgi:hypothetical protein
MSSGLLVLESSLCSYSDGWAGVGPGAFSAGPSWARLVMPSLP